MKTRTLIVRLVGIALIVFSIYHLFLIRQEEAVSKKILSMVTEIQVDRATAKHISTALTASMLEDQQRLAAYRYYSYLAVLIGGFLIARFAPFTAKILTRDVKADSCDRCREDDSTELYASP